MGFALPLHTRPSQVSSEEILGSPTLWLWGPSPQDQPPRQPCGSSRSPEAGFGALDISPLRLALLKKGCAQSGLRSLDSGEVLRAALLASVI